MSAEPGQPEQIVLRIAPSHRAPDVMAVRVGTADQTDTAKGRLGRLAAAISSKGVEMLGLEVGQA